MEPHAVAALMCMHMHADACRHIRRSRQYPRHIIHKMLTLAGKSQRGLPPPRISSTFLNIINALAECAICLTCQAGVDGVVVLVTYSYVRRMDACDDSQPGGWAQADLLACKVQDTSDCRVVW